MLLSETQKRRNKDRDIGVEQNEKVKYKRSMKACLKKYWKKAVIVLVVLAIFIKIWLLLTYEVPDVILPDQKGENSGWKFSSNPQGLKEENLIKLLEKIEKKEDISKKRKDHSIDETKEKLKDLKVPKVGKPYSSPGSLNFSGGHFKLDGKDYRMMSGAMHYFRVMREYWEDRMLKMKACGLNTLETYVPWNLHEDVPGKFNIEDNLDIRAYLELAQKHGLYVVLRPGPYICSEWEFGGLPAWLLKDPNMKVRSNYQGYKDAVERYFKFLIPMVAGLQHKHGGPIIAVQIENEFGSYSSEMDHLQFIKQLLIKNGIVEMLFISDGIVNSNNTGFHVAPFYTESLPTVNFMKYELGEELFKVVRSVSNDYPLVAMEFWSGWFDHWGQNHAFSNAQVMASDLQQLLNSGASVNFYMFHGGTNFGFMNGANWFDTSGYSPTITSYDYIAPLSEAGDITPKYELIRALIRKNVLEPNGIYDLPEPPPNSIKGNYGTVVIDHYLQLEDMLSPIKPISSDSPVSMERLDVGNGYGQNYGFILYRASVKKGTKLTFSSDCQISDRAQVLMNGIEVGVLTWHSKYWTVDLPSTRQSQSDENLLDILVENHGRVNFVLRGFNRFNQEQKGILGNAYIDGRPIRGWKIYPLEFKKPYLDKVLENKSKWKIFANWVGVSSLYSGMLFINGTPKDTFVNMKGWHKGVVFVNGFNLGRYWKDGPQKTLYVPAPVLKTGNNMVMVFELHKASHSVIFQDEHIIS